MKCVLLALSVLLVSSLGLPARSSAQAVTIHVTAVGDGEAPSDPFVLNASQCAANVPLDLEIENIGATGRDLDFWRGANCQDVATRGGGGGVEACDFLPTPSRAITTRPIQYINAVPLQSLIGPCLTNGTPTYEIFVFMTETEMSSEVVTTNWGVLRITVDFDVPPAPLLASHPAGASTHLTWTESPEVTDLYQFLLFSEPSLTPDCSSISLVAGDDAPSVMPALMFTGDAATADIDTPATGTHLAVALIAVDRAGNRSKLSNIACVAGEPLDDASIVGGDAGPGSDRTHVKYGCSCDIARTREQSAPLTVLGAVMLGLALLRAKSRARR